MKAARFHRFGGPEQVQLDEMDRPIPKQAEALIQVRAAGVNPVDWKIVDNEFNETEDKLPQTVGQDFAGEIVSMSGESDFKKDERVLGQTWGSYAEYISVPIKDIVRIPPSMTFETAAAIPMPALTAWQVVHNAAHLSQGKRVLIHGAGGAVGSFAVQFAKLAGAYVIGTAGHSSFDHLQDLGIDEVIDYKNGRFEKRASDIDVVIDSQGGEVQKKSFRVMRKEGLLINLIGEVDEKAAREAGVHAIPFRMKYNIDDLKQIVGLVENGRVRAEVAQVFQLDKAREALKLSQEGKTHGKVVLKI
jgi:NADPH:quinone reductase-like Zn-dependent oxidoreductase